MIFPVSVSVLTNAYPAASASRAIGTAYGIAGLGNAAGPLVGGVLTETVGWRAVFWLLVPFTLISLVIGARVIPESFDETAPRRIDLSGLALITVGIGLFTLAFDRAPTWGWLSPATIGAGIAAVVLLTAFVAVERRTRHLLVDLGLFGNPGFAVLVVAGTVANIAYVVTVFLTTLNLQQVRGLDPLMAGVVFLGPSAGAALGRHALRPAAVGVLSGPRDGDRMYRSRGFPCRTDCFRRMGGVRDRAHGVGLHHGIRLRVHHCRHSKRWSRRRGPVRRPGSP